jgi:redox-sensitive bicupin YhaK (pirin superfamily)
MMNQHKTIRAITTLSRHQMSAGFSAYSLRGASGVALDPFISVDHFYMSEPTFPPHPHAGFSAVTYMFEDSAGAFTNRDSLGDQSLIKPGAIHWTQAARGIIHEEIPVRRGVESHGIQMFVNLKEEHKQAPPKAFHVEPSEVPAVSFAGGRARVLAGTFSGAESPLRALLTPILFLDVHLERGARVSIPVPNGDTGFVMAIKGSGLIGDQALPANGAASFSSEGERLTLEAGEGGLQALIGAGTPIQEPVVFGGPFVMTRQQDILEAKQRYQRGEMGRLSPSF